MKIIDQSFYTPRTPVAVIDCEASGEASLIRGLLENLDAAVTLHLPGTPVDFLLTLGQDAFAPEFIVICGHGDAEGIVFGEYGPGVDTSCLVNGRLPARALAGKVRLPGRIVLSTACMTGTEEFGRTFLDGGARAYIAPSSYPGGSDAVLFVHHFFHNTLCRGMALETAWLHARSYDEESGMFTLFGPCDTAIPAATS
jgi:hypothetical protein